MRRNGRPRGNISYKNDSGSYQEADEQPYSSALSHLIDSRELTDAEKWARDIGIVSPHHPPKSLCDAYLESSWYKDTSKKQTGNRREIAKEFFLGRDSLAEVFARRGQRRDNNGAQLNDAEKKPGFLADYFASRCR